MCGIIGLVGNFEKPENLLSKMGDCIKHRGPDQNGTFFDLHNNIFLAHQRLSILDCSDKARQPMRRGDAIIVFNGEIYNYREIYQELKNEFEFSSTSDTEVLIYGYLKWGFEGLLDRIKGMFAFVFMMKKIKNYFLQEIV